MFPAVSRLQPDTCSPDHDDRRALDGERAQEAPRPSTLDAHRLRDRPERPRIRDRYRGRRVRDQRAQQLRAAVGSAEAPLLDSRDRAERHGVPIPRRQTLTLEPSSLRLVE
jgi:hypothetical protein